MLFNFVARVCSGLPIFVGSIFSYRPFFHRALAAFAAMADRFLGVRAAVLAMPPLSPPARPRAIAAGSLAPGSPGSYFGACPVLSNMIWNARALESRGLFFVGMSSVCQEC